MKNEAIIKSIITLLDAYNKTLSDKSNQGKRNSNSLKYLINQSIREYEIPSDNWHVSKAALALWKDLTKEDIKNYHYRDVVKCDNLKQPWNTDLFQGANKEGDEREIFPNDSFLFNELFHEDHVIPVSLILEEIVKLKKINYKSIKEVLDKMHICVILKEEDRKLGRTKGRNIDFNKTIVDVYNKNGVELFY